MFLLLILGRSNIVTGVAKAIKAHLQKHPLAIVNVKGRAKGTSVQELVSKLEVCSLQHAPSDVFVICTYLPVKHSLTKPLTLAQSRYRSRFLFLLL